MGNYKIIDKRSQQKKETILLSLVALLALSNIKIASDGLIMRHFIDNLPKYELYTAISLKDYARQQAIEYGIDPDQFARLINCESEWKVDARNPNSSAKGLTQIIDSTWNYYKCNGDQNNGRDNINCSLKIIKKNGLTAWDSSKNCWQ